MGNLEERNIETGNCLNKRPNLPFPEIENFSALMNNQINAVMQKLSWMPSSPSEVMEYLKEGGVLQIEYDKTEDFCLQDTFFYQDQKYYTKTSLVRFNDSQDFVEPYSQGTKEVPLEYVNSIILKLITRGKGEFYQL
ncbi:MAG TPA: hypothetical protein PLQ36_00570 [Candidatus Gracilibacteria bacterium]|nr:hypothetical protein [Candidatus Gracilibacteria bacterium]